MEVTNLWQDEWPTEPGYWWFYGWKFRKIHKGEEPKTYLVKVRKLSIGTAYVTDGHFLYKKEGAEGKWMKATLPEPSTLMMPTPEEKKAKLVSVILPILDDWLGSDQGELIHELIAQRIADAIIAQHNKCQNSDKDLG